MNSRLVVSTECPACGAPLDFHEGSTALRCDHCRSNLLVTGRKQVLGYAVSPHLTGQGARTLTWATYKRNNVPCRVGQPQLYFIPYYRLTGHDFCWETVPPSKEEQEELLGINEGTPVFVRLVERKEATVQFRDRYVEKNFVACDLVGAGLYSLGIRPAVLRLGLFRRETLEANGRIVSVTTSPEVALSQGLKVDLQNVLYRQVLSQVLSVIYFPFWAVELECQGEQRLTIVDAVAETVVTADAPLSLYTVLNRQPTAEPQVIGFRPLTCPNCGWDLPVKPDDVIFYCSSCSRAWQIEGQRLFEVSHQIAERLDTGKPQPIKHLPFWVLQAEIKNRPWRFFLPAFRYRRLKFLSDLATNISRQQPAYTVTNNAPSELSGCYYDQEDALRLAQFTHVGLQAQSPKEIRAVQDEQLSIASAALTWFPFHDQGYSLVDPFTKTSLPRNLLL